MHKYLLIKCVGFEENVSHRNKVTAVFQLFFFLAHPVHKLIYLINLRWSYVSHFVVQDLSRPIVSPFIIALNIQCRFHSFLMLKSIFQHLSIWIDDCTQSRAISNQFLPVTDLGFGLWVAKETRDPTNSTSPTNSSPSNPSLGEVPNPSPGGSRSPHTYS